MKFEDSMKKLETLVRRMESGDMNLDDMIKAFEEGRTLAEECRKELEAIRLKIDKVTATGLEPVEVRPDGDVAL